MILHTEATLKKNRKFFHTLYNSSYLYCLRMSDESKKHKNQKSEE